MTSPLEYRVEHAAIYYVAPRTFEPARLFTSAALTVLVAIVVAAAYIFAWTKFNSVFIHVGAAAATGVAIGCLTAGAIRYSRVSSVLPALFLAIVVSAVTLYCSWLFWLGHILNTLGFHITIWRLIVHPVNFAHLMLTLGRNGVWAYEGQTYRGPILFIIWLVEAAMIFTIPAMIAAKSTSGTAPVCRGCGRPCSRRGPTPRLSAHRTPEIAPLVEAKNFDALLDIGPLLNDDAPQIDFELYSCRECNSEHVLSVLRSAWARNNQGRVVLNSVPLVKRLLLTSEEAEHLLALRPKLQGMKAKIEAAADQMQTRSEDGGVATD